MTMSSPSTYSVEVDQYYPFRISAAMNDLVCCLLRFKCAFLFGNNIYLFLCKHDHKSHLLKVTQTALCVISIHPSHG